MALVIVLISHSGFSSSTSAHVLGSDGEKHEDQNKKMRQHILVSVLNLICLFLCLPMARLSSFCTLELTPTILYKPCSSIPGEGRGGEERTDIVFNSVFLYFQYCTPAAFDTCEDKWQFKC